MTIISMPAVLCPTRANKHRHNPTLGSRPHRLSKQLRLVITTLAGSSTRGWRPGDHRIRGNELLNASGHVSNPGMGMGTLGRQNQPTRRPLVRHSRLEREPFYPPNYRANLTRRLHLFLTTKAQPNRHSPARCTPRRQNPSQDSF